MSIKPTFASEPVALPALLMALATAVLALAVGVGWIDDSDAALILGVVAAVIPLVAYFIQRPRVSPVQVEHDPSLRAGE